MSGSEMVDLVDETDAVQGSALLGDCLRRGLLHRAVAVLVSRTNGNLVLQKRSLSDSWNPGLLTISSTGHVRRGETYALAAARELSEELRLSSPLSLKFKVKMPPFRYRSLTEHEWVSFFTTSTDEPATPDPVELSGILEVPPGEMPRFLQEGALTEDARMLLVRYLAPTAGPG